MRRTMGFRLFGIDIEIQLGFWVMAFLFGWGGRSAPGVEVIVWMLVVFVSVLIHELGHGLTIKRLRIEPEISLHWMGGTTSWAPALPVGRRDHIIISLAGPFAGFAFGCLIFGGGLALGAQPKTLLATMLYGASPGLGIHPLVDIAFGYLMFVNFYWGLINLAPVLPFDGGHVLEHALGPARARTTAMISGVFGAGLCVYFLTSTPRSTWGAMLFGLAAFSSFQRWRASAAPVRVVRPEPRREPEIDVGPELAEHLRKARAALEDERFAEAVTHGERLLAAQPTGRSAQAALGVVAWAHLLAGRADAAHEALERLRKLGKPDAALEGSVARARGQTDEALRVLEAARSAGDERKEVAGPLIQILIDRGQVGRAAEIAHDIVETLSEGDARQMAALAFESRAFAGAARLHEAVFQRTGHAEDAYEAARARTQAGDHDKALELLRRAVAAGFSDQARAWSDAALAALQQGERLAAVVPRP
jgi:Zn-dependent protease/thioredoxin-like negative regulator of GroEL